jgi:bifunctional non-homologous end joining protein LigD
VVQAVRGVGGEGVIAKRKASTYQPGERSGDWVKLKLERQQEFVIGGYRPDGSASLDTLLVGVDGDQCHGKRRVSWSHFVQISCSDMLLGTHRDASRRSAC